MLSEGNPRQVSQKLGLGIGLISNLYRNVMEVFGCITVSPDKLFSGKINPV